MDLRVKIVCKGNIFEGKVLEIIHAKFLAAMHEAVMFIESKVKDKTPVVWGMLKGSVHGEVEKGSSLFLGTTGASVIGIVGHGMPYGDLVERGTGIYGPFKKAWTRGGKVQKGFKGRFMFKRTFEEDWGGIVSIFDRYGFEISQAI